MCASMLSPHRATNIMVSTDRLNSSSSTLGMARILHPIHPPVFIALQTANTVSQIIIRLPTTGCILHPIHPPVFIAPQTANTVSQIIIKLPTTGCILHLIHPPVFISLKAANTVSQITKDGLQPTPHPIHRPANKKHGESVSLTSWSASTG